MRKIFQYLRIILTVGFPIIFSPLYLRKYEKHPDKYSLDEKYQKVRKLINKVIRAFRVDIHVYNKEVVDNLNVRYLTLSNHLSMFEILAYFSISDKPITFAAKEETLKMPFVGRIFRILHGVPLDRKNVMNQLAEIKMIVNQIKDENMPLMYVFPEGTRNREPQNHCLEFKGGTIKLAYMAKVPIVTISTYGSFRVLDKHSYLKRYPLFIKFDAPIYPEEYKEINSIDLADTLKKRIDANIDAIRPIDKEEIYKQKLSKKRKEKETRVDIINV